MEERRFVTFTEYLVEEAKICHLPNDLREGMDFAKTLNSSPVALDMLGDEYIINRCIADVEPQFATNDAIKSIALLLYFLNDDISKLWEVVSKLDVMVQFELIAYNASITVKGEQNVKH